MAIVTCLLAPLFSGCQPAPRPSPGELEAAAKRAEAADEVKRVAEASLGKQSEVLAQGDLARDGREQLFVVNRFAAGEPRDKGDSNSAPMLITRAVVLEKNGEQWSEILRCDEHVKNPHGYLGGSPAGRVNGWRLEYRQDSQAGLELKLTPAERLNADGVSTNEHSGQKNPTFEVRWNLSVKRYQTFDASHERYLSEVPSLETPQSTLR
jgi:hypothetical protein